MLMKKYSKMVCMPQTLKDKLINKLSMSFTGSITDGFIFYLNQNIELLKKEGIIDKQVKLICKKSGQIEFGQFSENVIKNLFQRPPYKGKKKLIKSLIIALFSDEWKSIFNSYFDNYGNLKADQYISQDFVENENDTILNKKHINFKKSEKKFTIGNWNFSTNYSTPQWADFLMIPLEDGLIKRVKCNIKTTSEYYRFGFKLFRSKSKLFGDGSIQSMNNNFVIHVGKNSNSDELFITSYHNGIRQRKDKYTGIKPLNNKFEVLLYIDNEDFLYLFLNNKEVFKNVINKEIREQIYMLAWGDGNEYKICIENIEIEVEYA